MDSPQAPTTSTAPDADEYSIDELAAHTGVPSRTIRFYQSKKALPAPERRGRKAVYSTSHVERLRLIGRLQDQGLTIRAIRNMLASADRGELRLGDWFGIRSGLQVPWADDAPQIVTNAELVALTGSDRDGLIGQLVEHGMVERSGDRFTVASPALVALTMRLERAGIGLQTSAQAARLLRRHLSKAANDVSRHFLAHLSSASAADSDPERVSALFDTLRPAALEAVQLIFAREMERALQDAIASGRITDVVRRG